MGINLQDRHSTINAINLRKKSENDDRVLCMSGKITIHNVPIASIAPILGCDAGNLSETFFDHGTLRFPFLESVSSLAKFKGGHRMKIANKSFRPDSMQGFTFLPLNAELSLADVSLQITVMNPAQNLVSTFVDYLTEEAEIIIESDPELDFGGYSGRADAEESLAA